LLLRSLFFQLIQYRDHMFPEQFNRAHDLVVRDVPCIGQTEEKVGAGRLVSECQFQAVFGSADKRPAGAPNLFEIETGRAAVGIGLLLDVLCIGECAEIFLELTGVINQGPIERERVVEVFAD